jgi:sulfatase maturation enzyme AslB (radical SAM superfamily)
MGANSRLGRIRDLNDGKKKHEILEACAGNCHSRDMAKQSVFRHANTCCARHKELVSAVSSTLDAMSLATHQRW